MKTFLHILLLGPLMSGFCFDLSLYVGSGADFSSDEFISSLMMVLFVAYVMLFFSPFGMPGIVPLVLYAAMVSILVEVKLSSRLQAVSLKRRFVFILAICLGSALLVYVPFFYFLSHINAWYHLTLNMTVPSAFVISLWFTYVYSRELAKDQA